MPCNPKKDMSLCLAKTRIRVFTSRYFWDAYLWPDYDTQHAQTAVVFDPNGGPRSFAVVPDSSPAAAAHVCRSPYIMRYIRPVWCPQWLWDYRPWPVWLVDLLRLRHREYWWPKLGEIHFVRGKGWCTETVAHESPHAAITTARALGVNPHYVFTNQHELSPHFADTPVYRDASKDYTVSISDEELFCYIHGVLFEQMYAWLWKVDPPFDARRDEWSL